MKTLDLPAILVRWIITTLAIVMVPYLVSGVRVEGFGSALAAAAIVGILNAVVRPILIILTLPLTIVTMGVFILVINALLFQLAGVIVSGLEIDSFWSALLGSIIVSLVSWVINFPFTARPGGRFVIGRGWRDDRTVDMRRGKGGKWE